MVRRYSVGVLWVLIVVNSLISGEASAQENRIHIAGAMRNVMIKGDLSPIINLDTIRIKKHLYGIGPADQLKGEILIADGISYLSYVNRANIAVKKSFNAQAPFFV